MKKSTTLLFVMLLLTSSVYAQKIEFGMTRAEIAKSFPAYSAQLKTSKKSMQIKNFSFYGMSGVASFEFSGDKLSTFIWITPQPPRKLTSQENSQYGLMVHRMQADYGNGNSKPSRFNKSLLECKWETSKRVAEIEYHPNAVKFTLIGLRTLERAKETQH